MDTDRQVVIVDTGYVLSKGGRQTWSALSEEWFLDLEVFSEYASVLDHLHRSRYLPTDFP
jgi:hypothetical protein